MLAVAAFVASLLLIYEGSKRIVNGASCLALTINFHKVVIGTIFVASITSIPELASSLMAAIFGSSKMALGNIIGSNIYNVPLIVGICGLIDNLRIRNNSAICKECLFIVGVSALLMLLTAVTGMITWWIGTIFLALYVVFILYSLRSWGNCNNEKIMNGKGRDVVRSIAIMIFGGIALIFGTFLLVYSATAMAEMFGLSYFYAGFTIMALGCVVPEVAVSISAALRGEQEMSIGNVMGDNIITMTLVLGLISLIRSFTVSLQEVLTTVPLIILISLLLLIIIRLGRRVTRVWGLLMLTIAIMTLVLNALLGTLFHISL